MILTQSMKEKLVVQALKNIGDLLNRGIPLPDALEHIARTTSSLLPRRRLYALEKVLPSPAVFLEELLSRLREEVTEGSTLSQALSKQSIVPRPLTITIGQGESHGTLPKVLMELDGSEMDDHIYMIDSPIIKLVNGLLIKAQELSADSIAFPSLPDGQVVFPIESSWKNDAVPMSAAAEQELADFDTIVSESLDNVLALDENQSVRSAQSLKIYYKIEGKWMTVMVLPAMIKDPFTRRLLVMARIPYWSKQPQEGNILLRVGNELSEFRLAYDPVSQRVQIDLLPKT